MINAYKKRGILHFISTCMPQLTSNKSTNQTSHPLKCHICKCH